MFEAGGGITIIFVPPQKNYPTVTNVTVFCGGGWYGLGMTPRTHPFFERMTAARWFWFLVPVSFLRGKILITCATFFGRRGFAGVYYFDNGVQKTMSNFLDSYNQHVAERANLGVLPLPINLAQAEKIFTMLRAGEGQTAQLIELVENRFTMGGGAENLLRVQFLSDVIAGSVHVDGYSAQRALGLLRHTGTAGLKVLADLVLSGSQEAANELKLVPSLDVWGKLAENAQDPLVRQVLESFIQREWETQFPTPTEVKVSLLFITKPDGTVVLRITTDDYSQASHSSTRPDTALHSEQCLTGINPELLDYMKQYVCALIAGIQGEGSSRETGVEAPQRWMGEAIEYQANTWAGGIFIGEGKDGMFPIFAENLFNGGALGVCIDDVMSLFPYNRQEITIRPYDGEILAENGDVIATFTLDENQLGAYRVRSGIFWQEAQ